MKVILIEDIKGVGKKEDIINASDGHARNYLLPRKLAIEATEVNIKRLEQKKQNEKDRKNKELEEAKQLATKLENVKISIKVKSGTGGRLFGSVTNKEIGDELEKQSNLLIDKKKIILDEPIKSLGAKTVTIKLHPEVNAKVSVIIEEL